jgi:hypothetical protein
MTAETQTPARPPASAEPSLGVNWGVLSMWAIGLLVVLVVGMAFGLVSLNSKLDDLQQQVGSVNGSVSLIGGGGATGNVDDACRLMGALAFKAGVDIPTAFANEGATGTCETAAEEGFHQAKTG